VPADIGASGPDHRVLAHLATVVEAIDRDLERANLAREQALPACRRAIRAAGSSIRAVHRLDHPAAASLAAESESAVREAQRVLAPFPALAHAGFLHDAEKEYVEARAVAALVAGDPVLGPGDLRVSPTAWMRGVAEAASELRRHLLDRLREGRPGRGESLCMRRWS
jgi:translin